VRVVQGDAAAVREALGEALDGGTPILPVPPDEPSARRVIAAARPGEPLEYDDCALVLATSGSSGEPKAVVLSRAALLASATVTHDRLGGPGQWLLAMPPYFIGGLQVLTRSVVAGTDPVVAHGNLSDAAGRLTHERRYAALVPTQLRRLLASDLDALRSFDAVLVGGAAAPAELLARARDSGVAVVTTYGMTETGGGCVYDGSPLAHVLVDLDGDRILLGGPTLFSGYRLRPDLTAEALTDGWFRTADRGRLVDGRLEVLGRLDDVVVSGGVNVALPAVRDRLKQHPDVMEAEVIGVPDDEWGSRIVAFVVGTPARDALRDFVATELPRAWAPQQVVRVDALPMLASGKVDRQDLARRATDPGASPSS
jgi:o-succinylbenzoate---CoA ligase